MLVQLHLKTHFVHHPIIHPCTLLSGQSYRFPAFLISTQVLRRVEEAKVLLEKQLIEEFERQRQDEIKAQQLKQVLYCLPLEQTPFKLKECMPGWMDGTYLYSTIFIQFLISEYFSHLLYNLKFHYS